MWILESNGDFLQGKRMWLKPGKKYLFGRVKKDGVRFAIDHKTVSRKHFVITIDEVKDIDVGNIYARTKITITDENSKAGTNIDGESIKNKSQELTKPTNSVRPGTCPHELVVTWVPYVLTLALSKKEIKSGALKVKQDQVKELDIKAVSEYVTGQTTHVVVQKRNTAKGLQALVEGRFIVTEAYIDALIYASTPTDLQEEENLSPLEIDFDESWPDPSSYLPAPGKEPTDKPAEAYRPNTARVKVFEKSTFFFFDQHQYDQLLAPVTTGHGKALLFKAQPEVTKVQEAVIYVQNAIGTHRHAILVKLNESSEDQGWLTRFIENLCSELKQESASQSDLLDTILANDASQLCRPTSRLAAKSRPDTDRTMADAGSSRKHRLNGHTDGSAEKSSILSKEQQTTAGASPPPAASVPIVTAGSQAPSVEGDLRDTQQSSVQDDNPRPRKRPRFVPTQKPLDGFDDDFNPESIAAYEEVPSVAQTPGRTQRSARSQIDDNNISIKKEPQSRGRPGTPPSPQAADSDAELDDLLPAAAAMRKEKQQQEAEARRKGLPMKSAISQPKASTLAKPKKEVKLLDVREAVRARREAEEEAEKKERQELDKMDAEDQDQEGPANLVEVVHFQLPVRARSADVPSVYHGEAWKPEWDGRKNFKGFRRAQDVAYSANATNGVRRQRDKIIVPVMLEENQTYGLGDQYWPKTQEDKDRAARDKERKKRASQKSTQSQNQSSSRSQRGRTVQEESDSDDQSVEENQVDDSTSHTSPEHSRLQKEAEDVLDHPIDVDAPRQTRQAEALTQTPISSAATGTKSTKGAKRPASKTPSGRTAHMKKQKTLPVAVVHGSDSGDPSDDSDDMKFKFGRGKKARGARA